jgi:hypothetical protein
MTLASAKVWLEPVALSTARPLEQQLTLAVATGAWFDDVPQPAKAEMTTAAMMTSLLPARVRQMSIELP